MRILQSNKQAVEICRLLQNEGHEALLVGGCVRDAFLKEIPKDFDIATSAEPAEVEAACHQFKLDLVGRAFGVVIASDPNDKSNKVEIATFRSDGDGRKPEVKFVSSVNEDAARRDFTINALYYDPIKDVVIDPTGGIDDIDVGIIRTPGNAKDRMKEDVLRTLRAIRFASRFNFTIEGSLWEAIKENSSLIGVIEGDLIGRIPQERVIEEFKKGISTPTTGIRNERKGEWFSHQMFLKAYLNNLENCGLWENMFPGADKIQDPKHAILFVHDMTKSWEQKGYKSQENFIKALGFGNDEVAISNMVKYIESVALNTSYYFSAQKVKRAVEVLGEEIVESVFHDVAFNIAYNMSKAFIRFAAEDLRVDGSVVMAETGLPSGVELGAEIHKRDLETFNALISGNI